MIPVQTASRHLVTHLVFSPDGSAVAAAQPHFGVTVLDRATGQPRAVCAMPRRAALTDLTFCGGGRLLAAAYGKGLEVFDADTGASVLRNNCWPLAHRLAVRGSVVLVCSELGHTSLRRLMRVSETGASAAPVETVLFRQHAGFVASAPDGSRVLCADGSRAVLLDVGSDRTIAEIDLNIRTHVTAFRWLAKFCACGHRFAIGDGKRLDVYEAPSPAADGGDEPDQPTTPLVQRANGTPTAVAPMPHTLLAPTFTLKPGKPNDAPEWYPPFALAADGRGLLVKRPRNRVQWWDAPTGTLVNEWSWHFEWVTCVAVSDDGLTAAVGGRFGRVLLWDLE